MKYEVEFFFWGEIVRQKHFPSGQEASSTSEEVTVITGPPPACGTCPPLCQCREHQTLGWPLVHFASCRNAAPSWRMGPGHLPSLFLKKCFQKWHENTNWEVLWGRERMSYNGHVGQWEASWKLTSGCTHVWGMVCLCVQTLVAHTYQLCS